MSDSSRPLTQATKELKPNVGHSPLQTLSAAQQSGNNGTSQSKAEKQRATEA